jgi:hypothetical protein
MTEAIRKSESAVNLLKDPQFKTDRIKAVQQSRKIREDLTEEQIDKSLKDSFPASDPPSTY